MSRQVVTQSDTPLDLILRHFRKSVDGKVSLSLSVNQSEIS